MHLLACCRELGRLAPQRYVLYLLWMSIQAVLSGLQGYCTPPHESDWCQVGHVAPLQPFKCIACITHLPAHSATTMCRYGPRQSERKFGFSDRGRLVCEVHYVSLAQKARGKQAQVGISSRLASTSCGADCCAVHGRPTC